jgi:hypothetical protein
METLHQDLIRYVVNGRVRHPFVAEDLTTGASYINQAYRDKLDRVKEADADGKWGLYVGSASGLTVLTPCSLQLTKP